MPNEPTASSDAPKPQDMSKRPKGGGGGETRSQSPAQRFVEAYDGYVQSLQSAMSDAQKQCEDAARQMAEQQQEAWSRTMQQAQQAFTSQQQEGSGPSPQDFEKSQQQYARALQDSWTETQKRYERAYQQYVRSLQEAWSQVDSASLDACQLLVIGQSIQAAAAMAQSTMGRWDVVGSWATMGGGSGQAS